ncbi:phage tail terminator protein [Photobacterium minamisatsumaniensis]|uniref:phage tail terminator protein n=1 Tax=Photobacterium minamisatsumaniensis TaxID=2910233 RepID=UPI003D148996
MDDLVALTVARLKADSPPWKDVSEIDALSQLDLKTAGTTRTPALYVFLVGETPSPDVRGAGAYLQSLTATVGVVIVDASRNGKPINLQPLRKALRKRLFGWSGADDFEPYWLGGGRLLTIQSGRASWLDNFVTEYTEDQNAYGP